MEISWQEKADVIAMFLIGARIHTSPLGFASWVDVFEGVGGIDIEDWQPFRRPEQCVDYILPALERSGANYQLRRQRWDHRGILSFGIYIPIAGIHDASSNSVGQKAFHAHGPGFCEVVVEAAYLYALHIAVSRGEK